VTRRSSIKKRLKSVEDKLLLWRTNLVCGRQALSVEDKLHKLHLVIKKDAVQQPMTVSLFSISFVYNNHCYFVITSCLKIRWFTYELLH